MKQSSKKEIRLGLFEYYSITAINSIGVSLFVSCCFFWAKQKFEFSDTENLILAALQGFVYIFIPSVSGKLSDRIGYDRMIAIGTAGSGVTMLLGWMFPFSWTPYLISALLVLFSASTWPSLEACVLYSKGTLSLPNRVGLYNIDWSLGNVVGYFLGGALFAWQRDAIVWFPILIFVVQLLWLRRPVKKGVEKGLSAMDIPHRGANLSQVLKNRFMYISWLANSMGYFLVFVLGAVMPYLSERLNLRPEYMIWLSCTAFFARTIGFIVLWMWEGWHYKMSALQSALWLSPLFLAGIFYSQSVFWVFIFLLFFGWAIGLSYNSSIYYSLNSGENKGELGGYHESMIGVGEFTGPLVGAIAARFYGGVVGAQWSVIIMSLVINGAGLAWIYRKKH